MAELSLGAVVYALDLARMREFYREVFQLDTLHVEPDFVTLQTGAAVVTFVQAPIEIVEQFSSADQPERQSDNPIKLSFPVDDIGAARERAARHGGSIDDPETEWQFGALRVCDGVDPEGNVVQARQLMP
jgi:predicted enzyme related to lactoylglutathione lyase